MRGSDNQQQKLFSYLSPETRVPQRHPLRPIRQMTGKALKELSPVFLNRKPEDRRCGIASTCQTLCLPISCILQISQVKILPDTPITADDQQSYFLMV